MTFNVLLIIFLLLVAINCIIGAKKGMVKILFTLFSWILVIWFINFSTPFITDFLTSNTTISSSVESLIQEGLQSRFDAAESQEIGSGETTIIDLLPNKLQEEVNETVENSIEATILFVAEELTATAIHGIAVVMAIVVSLIAIKLIDLLLSLVDYIPGLNSVNRMLGLIAGVLQALFITWLLMMIAEYFPATALGSYVISNSQESLVLSFLYNNNLIAAILGL